MPLVQLSNRSIIDVAGPEAEPFLQNIVTTDLDHLKEGELRPSALLTPQGKILFDFLVSRTGTDALALECREDIADDLHRRLMLYKLRAKVTISKREQALVSVSWDIDSAPSQSDSTTLRDRRFPDEAHVSRSYASGAGPTDAATWHALRVRYAVAESGPDYALGDAFPHDVLLDQNGGVGFRKGCYVGQEVVSRMQHRGTARRRVLMVSAASDLPPPGSEIIAAGRALGTLGTVSGAAGLAIVRIDRVKDALDAGTEISAGGVTVELAIPRWVNFTFPQGKVDAESA